MNDHEMKYKKAFDLAVKAHSGQKRKDGKDYITHPIAVADIVWYKLMPGWTARTVAILHDVIEDTDVTYEQILEEFGPTIADAVALLSRKKDESYFDFIMRLVKSDNILAIMVKIADLEHNLSDLQEGSMKDKYRFAHYFLKRNIQ